MNTQSDFLSMYRKRYFSRTGMRGFSLMELLMVVVIMGILLAIAMPAYNNYIMKSRRSLAKSTLLDLAQREEKFYSLNNTYSATASDLGYPAGTVFPMPVNDSGGVAVYTIAAPTLTAPTATAPAIYSASAVPTGAQTGDMCGTLTVDSLGRQTAAVSSCW